MQYSKNQFTLGLIQRHCTEDREDTFRRTLSAVEKVADTEAEIICLQELFATQYFCQQEEVANFDLAETIPGPSTEALSKVAKAKQVVIVASLFEKRAPGVFHNTAAVIDADGSLMGTYRKMHIPDDPLYHEKFYFTPGDQGYRVFDTRYARVGVLVCWDQWFPEAARLTALKGAEVLIYPTAIGWHPSEKEKFGEQQHSAWETVQRGHAISNGVYLAAVNRVGNEGGLQFWGQSFVSDPFGEVIARGSTEKDEVLIVPCERKRLEDVRRNWPFFRDRRIDSYQDITERYQG